MGHHGQMRPYKQETFTSHCSGGWLSEIEVPADPRSGEASFWFTDDVFFLCSTRGGAGGSGGVLEESTDLIMGAPPSRPRLPPWAPLPAHDLGVRLEHTDSQQGEGNIAETSVRGQGMSCGTS